MPQHLQCKILLSPIFSKVELMLFNWSGSALSIRPFAKKLSLSLKIPKPLVIQPINIFLMRESPTVVATATQDCVVVIIVAVAPSARPAIKMYFFI